MLNLKKSDWDRPLTDSLPGLAEYQRKHLPEDGPAWTVQWDQITLAALAAQIAGVPRDALPYYLDVMLDNDTVPVLVAFHLSTIQILQYCQYALRRGAYRIVPAIFTARGCNPDPLYSSPGHHLFTRITVLRC